MAADSACLRAQHKAAARKTHGVAAFTEDELAERDAAIRATAFEEGAQEGAQAVIDAQEEDMERPTVRKVIENWGTGMSMKAQKNLAKHKTVATFADVNQTLIAEGEELLTLQSSSAAAQKARLTLEQLRVLTIVTITTLIAVMEAVMNQYQMDAETSPAEFLQGQVPKKGFWSDVAAHEDVAKAWECEAGCTCGDCSYSQPKQRGQIVKALLEDHFDCRFKKEYQFRGPRRELTVEVEDPDVPDKPFTFGVLKPDFRLAVGTPADIAAVCGGVHKVPTDLPTNTKSDITFSNLSDAESSFHDAFRKQDMEEAAGRGLGLYDDENEEGGLPTPQTGSYMKVETPGLKALAERNPSEKGTRIVALRNPQELVQTHVTRMAVLGCFQFNMTRPAVTDGAAAAPVPTLKMRAMLCPDHESIFDKSVAVCQLVFFLDKTDETTRKFLDENDREKVQRAMGAVSYPVYMCFGLPEGGDGYEHVEGPLIGVVREMLFNHTFEVKGNGFHFKVHIDHCGCGSLTADEKARCLALGRKGGWEHFFSFACALRAGYTDYVHLSTSKIITVEYLWEMAKDYESSVDDSDPATLRAWKERYPGFDRPCGQISGKETMAELEQKCGSRKAPMGAVEILHCLEAPNTHIFANYNLVRPEARQQRTKENLNAAVGGRAFMDVLPADKSQVLRICSDPEKAFGDTPLRLAWAEFRCICFWTCEIYSYCAIEEPTRQDELAMWFNCFNYGCLTVDLVEAGHFPSDGKHCVISKYMIQLWFFLPKMYGVPTVGNPHRDSKARASDFCMQVQEQFMQMPRRYAKAYSNHGSGNGEGFDESNVLEQIFLRYDCECLFRFVTGCSSSHSVKSRSDSYLAAHRNNKAKCQWDAFIPSDMLKPGRAAERFLPQLKANLAAEKNANGTARFDWDRDVFTDPDGNVVAFTVTQPPARRLASLSQRTAQNWAPAPKLAKVLAEGLKLKCAWRLEKTMKVADDGKSVTWAVRKEVRRKECIGCVPVFSKPKPDEESVGTTLLRECCKHYHATELRFSEENLHGWGSRRFKQNKRLRTKKNGTGSNALSGLRAPELAAEFKRLRTKYLGDATMPEPPALAHVGVTLEDLAVEVETSFDAAGDDHDWPTEFADDTLVTPAEFNAAVAAVDEEMEEDAPEFDLHDASEAATRLLARAGVAPEAGAAPAGQRQSRSARQPKRFRDAEPAVAPRRSSRGSGARM